MHQKKYVTFNCKLLFVLFTLSHTLFAGKLWHENFESNNTHIHTYIHIFIKCQNKNNIRKLPKAAHRVICG